MRLCRQTVFEYARELNSVQGGQNVMRCERVDALFIKTSE